MEWRKSATAVALCSAAIVLSGCLADVNQNPPVESSETPPRTPDDHDNAPQEETPRAVASSEGANLELYGDFDAGLTREVGESAPALLLDDSTSEYAAAGMTVPEQTGQVQALAETSAFEDEVNGAVERFRTALEQEGANLSELVNRVREGLVGKIATRVLDVTYDATTTSSGAIRNRLLGEIGSDASLTDLPETGSADQGRFRLALAFVETAGEPLVWFAAYPVETEEQVNRTYGALNNGASVVTYGTSSQLQSGRSDFSQTASNTNGVDILWVIDNSGSMGEEQDNLGDGVEQFFNKLNSAGVDFRLAATTTDGSTCAQLQPLPDDQSSDFITPSTPDAARQWSHESGGEVSGIARPGTSGSGNETGFFCADEVDRAGFDRSKAPNVVVFVSDEAEHETADSSVPAGEYSSGYQVRDFETYRTGFMSAGDTFFAIVGEHTQVRNTFADTYGDEYQSACTGEGGNAQGGSHYREIARESGGSAASICSDAASWSVMYDEIIETATGLASSFRIDHPVLPNSAVVSINGEEVARDTARQNGFDVIALDGGTNLVFYGDAIPVDGDRIAVTYDYVPAS